MDLTLPDLGENMEEAEVLGVLVREGEAVEKDQPLLELETDKATFELPSPEAGTVSAVHVKKGDTVRVGQRILTLEAGARARDGGPARETRGETPSGGEGAGEQPRREDASRPREVREPAGAREGPERRTREQPRAEPGAEKAGSAPKGRHARTEARVAPRGDEDGREARVEPAGREEVRASADVEIAAGPATRRLARELDVDLVRIRGTGSGGRITPEDVQAFVREQAGARPAAAAAPPAEDVERGGGAERQALTGIEKTAARHLSAAWSEIPHVTHHDLADVTELEEARRRYQSRREEPKLTWTALVVKAAVAGLRAFPRVNSRLDAARDELVLERSIHIGVAVDTEHGLLVPVLRDADRKTTRQIAGEIASLAERARARKLGREEMQGATFTVTNLGGLGGVAFTPIISRPQVAILGVSRSREEIALRDGQVAPRIMLPLSLSYDHRVINGADAARFVRHVADLLEDPLRLVLES